MSEDLVLNLVAIKEGKIEKQERPGPWFRTSELVRCPHCSTRYWIMIEPGGECVRQREPGIMEAYRFLAQIISDEHDVGHSTARLTIPYQCPVATMN